MDFIMFYFSNVLCNKDYQSLYREYYYQFFGVLHVDSYADVYLEDPGSYRTVEPILNFVGYLFNPKEF